MLKEFGLVPSLLSALDDPFVKEPLPYWGGQAVWADILGDPAEDRAQPRHAVLQSDADEHRQRGADRST